MRPLATTAAVLAFALAAAGATQQRETAPTFTCKFEYFEKTFGIVPKSIKMAEDGRLKITLEISKDVANLKEARAAFGAQWQRNAGGGSTHLKEPPGVWFIAFDDENVVLKKYNIYSREGEVTGKSGDAFRIDVEIDGFVLKKTKKLEVRPVEQEKK